VISRVEGGGGVGWGGGRGGEGVGWGVGGGCWGGGGGGGGGACVQQNTASVALSLLRVLKARGFGTSKRGFQRLPSRIIKNKGSLRRRPVFKEGVC